MTDYLLDTTVLVNAIRRRQGKAELLRYLLTQGGNLACSTITIAEIYAGMRPHEKERTKELFAQLVAHDVTSAIAAVGGLLKNEWAAKGRILSITDMPIAATAIMHKCVLVTDNVKDFPMSEVRLYPLK